MRRAFTLIELMVVCGVLVLIAGIILPNVVQMKKSRDRAEAYRTVFRLVQAGRETAIQSGRTYTLTLNGSNVELNRDEDAQIARDGTSGATTPYVTTLASTGATSNDVPRLPRFALDGAGQPVTTGNNAVRSETDPDGAGASLPDGASFGNVTLDDKTSSTSEFTLHFFPDGHSEGGGFEMQEGSATQSVSIDRNGIATLQDGSLPTTAESNWEAGTYAQRTTSATTTP